VRIRERLLSPNFWVAVFSLMAALGLLCAVMGSLLDNRFLQMIWPWLAAPIVVLGVILAVAVIPILIFSNWRHRQK
jgi:membrane protein YdbS with pleckstrin-like domain